MLWRPIERHGCEVGRARRRTPPVYFMTRLFLALLPHLPHAPKRVRRLARGQQLTVVVGVHGPAMFMLWARLWMRNECNPVYQKVDTRFNLPSLHHNIGDAQ